MKTLLIPIIMLLAFSEMLHAGKEGNGGDAILCYNSNQKVISAELLDYYEANKRSYIEGIELGAPNQDYHKKVISVLERLRKHDSFRANRYLSWYTEFFLEENFSWESNLGNIADSGTTEYGKNCKLLQVAAQEKPLFPGDKRYRIVKHIWNEMTEDHKAGLILHELIYREALEIKEHFMSISGKPPISVHTDSRKVRYYNAVISSKGFSQFSEKDYRELIILTDMIYTTKDSFAFPIQSIDWANKKLQPVMRNYFPGTGKLQWARHFSKEAFLGFLYGQNYKTKDGFTIYNGTHLHELKFSQDGDFHGYLTFGFDAKYRIKLSPTVTLNPSGYDWASSMILLNNGEVSKKQYYFKGSVEITTDKLKAIVHTDQKNGAFHFSLGENFENPSFKESDERQHFMNKEFVYNGRKYNLHLADLRVAFRSLLLNLHFDSENGEPKVCVGQENYTGQIKTVAVSYCGYLKDVIHLSESQTDIKKSFPAKLKRDFKRSKKRCENYLNKIGFNNILQCIGYAYNCKNKSKGYCGHQIYGKTL